MTPVVYALIGLGSFASLAMLMGWVGSRYGRQVARKDPA